MASDLTQEELDAIMAQIESEDPMSDEEIQRAIDALNNTAPVSKGMLQL